MRIALLYPPPSADAGPVTASRPPGAGPFESGGAAPPVEDDAIAMPLGLMSIAAQARRAGHRVTLLNLSAFSWRDITDIVAQVPAEVYGLSCLTVNRHGARSLSRLIRRLHPGAHIVAGGCHVSALARETLGRWPDVDAVVIGEGEITFMEILRALAGRRPTAGIPGTAVRRNGSVVTGEPRGRIRRPDTLASLYDDFPSGVLLCSRGCPHACTYCGSPVMWPGGVRYHSADAILGALDRIVRRHGRRCVAVKDDTFTANRRLALEICRRLRAENPGFVWSCDTRADALDEELLSALRRAGCQRISMGVESAAPEILANVNKRVSPRQVLAATRMAKRFGFQIRYYMMAGNRGETAKTLSASIAFLARARPSQFVFSFLSLYPGTEEFRRAVADGLVPADIFFESPHPVVKCFRKARGGPELRRRVDWVLEHPRVEDFWRYSVAMRERILDRLPGLPAAHLDLAVAHLEAGHLRRAETGARRALDLGFPLPGLAHNTLAVIAAARGDTDGAARNLDLARAAGAHRVVERNLETLEEWRRHRAWRYGLPLVLAPHRGFERSEPMEQPAMPGPIRLRAPGGGRLAGRAYLPLLPRR